MERKVPQGRSSCSLQRSQVRGGRGAAILRVVAVLAGTAAFALPAPALAEEIENCGALAIQLTAIESRPTSLAKVRAFEAATSALELDPLSDCSLALVGRTRFGHADTLDRYARSFDEGTAAARNWSRKAAEAFEAYLAWFVAIDLARVDGAIRQLRGAQNMPSEEFRSVREEFLRKRVGNVINGMTQSYLRAGDFDAYFDSLERYRELPIEAFPKQVVEQWHYWLLAQPDFRHKRDEEAEQDAIQEVIQKHEQSRFHWNVFALFLGRYAQQGQLYEMRWGPVQARVATWLAS